MQSDRNRSIEKQLISKDKKNFLWKLDPRCKLLMMACVSTGGMLTARLLPVFLLLCVTLMTLLLARVKLSQMVRQIRGALLLISSLFLIQCLFIREGTPLLKIENFTLITQGGFHTASLLTLRFLIIVFSALIVLNGEARDYLLALVQCKVPYEMAFMVMAGLHFLPILREEAYNVYYSVQLRGTELKRISLLKKIKAYAKICLPILVGTIYRGKAMAVAMEARGLRARHYRTYFRKLTLTSMDKMVMIFFVFLTIALLIVSNLW